MTRIVKKWLSERIGVFILLGAIIAVAAAVAWQTHQTKATGVAAGTTIFQDVCRCRLILANGGQGVHDAPTMNPIAVAIQPSSAQVRFANIGFLSESDATSVRPAINPLPRDVNIAFGGSTVGTVQGSSARVQHPTGWLDSYRLSADITDIVQRHGSGQYRITEDLSTSAYLAATYVIVVLQDPSFPFASIAINNFFFSIAGGQQAGLPFTFQEGVNIPPVPAGLYYEDGSASIYSIGGSWQAGDDGNGAYTMGSAGGPLTNSNGTAFPNGFWARETWGQYNVPVLDSAARQLTMTVQNTGTDRGSAPAFGANEAAGWLIWRAQLGGELVVLPDTDTCYDDE
jgi:hypothetical protein